MLVAPRRAFLAAAVAAVAGIAALAPPTWAGPLSDWSMGGQNVLNTGSNPTETTRTTSTVRALGVKWTFQTHGDVSAAPAVVGDAVYFPDWGGYFYKVDARIGHLIWSHQISEYTGLAGTHSRTSPLVSGNLVYIGDRFAFGTSGQGAHLLAIDTRTGRLVWKTTLDPHPGAFVTGSPVIYDGVVYQGVSSEELGFASDPTYPCCSFRGSVSAVDARTGHVLWKTYTVPLGYSGGSVWGSTPAIAAAGSE